MIKRASTTSDGIPSKDWNRIHDLSLRYANTVTAGRRARAEVARRALLRALSKLEGALGERPSILATKADYVKTRSRRQELLLRAFDSARRRRDRRNITLIASSLAEFFADEVGDKEQAVKWIKELEQALSVHFDRTEANVLDSLKRRFR